MTNDNAATMKAIEQVVNGPAGDPAIVQKLEEFLLAAKQGKLVGITIVAALGPEAIMAGSAGALPCTLVTGLERMKQALIDCVFAQKRGSSLVLPGRRM